MKLIFSFIILTLSFLSVNAQDPTGGGGGGITDIAGANGTFNLSPGYNHLLNQQFFNDAFAGKYTAEKKYFDIKGNAFLSNKPIVGTLIMNDNSKIKDVPLQIDLYRHDIIATTAKGEDIYLNKKHFQEIIIPFEGRKISLRKINPEKPDQFYEVLYIDKNLVFFKEKYVTRKEAMSNGINNRPAEFTNRTKYFIKNGDMEITKVKLKKKKIFKFFDRKTIHKMNKFAKSNDIKFNNEYDYVDVFKTILSNP